MSIPDPKPGLVFRYEYLWKQQAEAGRDAAEKERPACIVLSVSRNEAETRVLVVPVTHSEPPAATPAIEIPAKVKVHLGLDAERSWIILSEANIDVWPSPDMRPIPGSSGRFDYGLLPLGLVRRMRKTVLDMLAVKRLKAVDRTSPPGTGE